MPTPDAPLHSAIPTKTREEQKTNGHSMPNPDAPLPLPRRLHQKRVHQARIHRCIRGFGWLEKGVALLCLLGVLTILASKLTPMPKEWLSSSTLSLRIEDRDGAFLHEEAASNGRFGAWLPGHKIPPAIRCMTLAAEDHRFEKHDGVDFPSVLRAIWSNVTTGRRVSGASTLAMQLLRQLRQSPRTYVHKIQEAYWALVFTHHLGRHGILREYLNRAPYGNRVQGIHRAALLYFDKPAADVSLAEAAFLAALPWAPSRLNPFHPSGYRRARKRAARILRRALKLRWLTHAQYQEAIHDPIRVQSKPKRSVETLHFTEHILRRWKQQKQRRPEHRIVTLRTTLDLSLQRQAQNALQKRLRQLRHRRAGTGSVAVMNHQTGELLAYVASPNYFDRKHRGAIDYIQTRHSPGSTLKPFVYAKAIDRQYYHGASLLADLGQAFLWKRGYHAFRNYDLQFLGPLRLRVALGNSRNIPAPRALSRVGVKPMLEHLHHIGIHSLNATPGDYGLGLALGAGEVKLLELTRAYALLAQQGSPVPLRWLQYAKDSHNRTQTRPHLRRPLFLSAMEPGQKLKPSTAQALSRILSDPIARLPSFKRYGHLEFPFPVAVKTGTSEGFRDAWMIGYSDRVVVACWIGNHDRRRMKRVSGALGCGPIFQTVMQAAMKRVNPQQAIAGFQTPQGWKKQAICPLSGAPRGPACEGLVEEWFPPHHKHTTTTCPFHKHIRIDKRNGLRAGPSCPPAFVETKSFLQVPPKYAMWAKAMSHKRPPKPFSPLCPQHTPISQTPTQLQLHRPLDKTRYVIDPTIPPEFSTISLEVKSSRRIPYVIWHINGNAIGQAPWPYTLRWKLRKGTHHIHATNPAGSIRSQNAKIIVR